MVSSDPAEGTRPTFESRNETPRYTIIADPKSLRFGFYKDDLAAYWKQYGIEPCVTVVSWTDLIKADGRIDELLAPQAPSYLRIESPARNFEVLRLLLQAGQRELGHTVSPWDPVDELEGWIASPRLIYLGLCRVLRGIDVASGRCEWLAAPNSAAIAEVFDKNKTSGRLDSAGLPTPEFVGPSELLAIKNRDDFLTLMDSLCWSSAYIKLAHGSCASGICFWESQTNSVERTARNDRDPSRFHNLQPTSTDRFTTTVCEIEGRFYNTRKVRDMVGDQADAVIEMILEEGATIQRAVSPLKVNGLRFDVRVVVLRGEVIATVFRASPHPMTNLHLGGFRADPEACRRIIPRRKWLDAMQDCVAAASLYDLPIVGVDLIFEQHTHDHFIIEINAFGDFLPNWRNADGRTIHSLEIESSAFVSGFRSDRCDPNTC